MTDNLTKEQRSKCMSRIRSTDTKVEVFFRKFIWNKNLRGYRLKSKIKGKPDLYFPVARLAVFIDGCFWHKCPKCFVRPKSRTDYWNEKISYNVSRDKKTNKLLRKERISVLRFWEHEIRENPDKCFNKLKIAYEKEIQNN